MTVDSWDYIGELRRQARNSMYESPKQTIRRERTYFVTVSWKDLQALQGRLVTLVRVHL